MSKEKMPVPVAGVGDTYTLLWAGSETISAIHERSGVKVGSLLVTIEQAEAYAAAKVREALEEAAKVCDTYFNEITEPRSNPYYDGALDAADILEQRIKELISQ